MGAYWDMNNACVVNMLFCCRGHIRHGSSGDIQFCGPSHGSNDANVCIIGSLTKASGSFSIPHPDPAKTATHDLRHSFVESPNEGDNLYRWQVSTQSGKTIIQLPSYYKHLNKNDMVWVSPYKHFGSAYGEVTTDQCCVIVCSNEDGCYNVFLAATRKDEIATRHWKGIEVERSEHDRMNTNPESDSE
jgi:hypothetical protein